MTLITLKHLDSILNIYFLSICIRYIFWNEHEPFPGVYDFEGQNDVFKFIEIAQKIGFVVILRPGIDTFLESFLTYR
jgi:beta-galactosidase GanA